MLAGEDGYRLSLAGAQSKLAVEYKGGRVQLIKGGAPTTHILKPQIEESQVKANRSGDRMMVCLASPEMATCAVTCVRLLISSSVSWPEYPLF